MLSRNWTKYFGLLGLLAAAAWLLLPLDAIPMLIWDESRNALNAQGMALHGHWLVPYYAGAPDHWNTKPPLLIWLVAGLMRLGLPPLIALRLPSLLAAMASLALIWRLCARALRDRLAGLAAGLVLLSATLYWGEHGAATGDYDTLLTALELGYVSSFWAALEAADGPARRRWLVAFAALLVCAVLTKGIAAALPLPGLALFAILRRRLGALLADWRVWLLMLATLGICIGYYLTRELYDPGYLHAIARNELGGRFDGVADGNTGPIWFYAPQLVQGFRPGIWLLPLGILTLRKGGRRGHLALACLCAATSLLVVLSLARTKVYWYGIPVIPLLAVVAGLGAADSLRLARDWGGVGAWAARLGASCLGLGLLFSVHAAYGWRQIEVNRPKTPSRSQNWVGPFLEGLAARGVTGRVIMVDSGMIKSNAPPGYDPLLEFYANAAAARRLDVTVQPPGAPLPLGARVGSCERAARRWVALHYAEDIEWRTRWCVLLRPLARRPADSVAQ